jgi:acetyl esterase/lipase
MRFVLSAAIVVGVFLSGSVGQAAEKVAITEDVVYGHKHGLAMTMDVFTPEENANGVGIMFMVSGGWFSHWTPPERAQGRFAPLLDRGYTVFAVRHGSSPKYNVPEIIPDVRRATRFVRLNAVQFGIDPKRLGVSGSSAGGHLALMLGTTGDDGDPEAKDPVLRESSRVAAVVAYFPPTDLRKFVNHERLSRSFPALLFDADKADDVSPLLQASQDDAPTLMIHGDQDQLVPIHNSTDMLAAFQAVKVPCKLITIEGAGHGFSGDNAQRAATAWCDWFDQHLLGK